MNKYKIIQVSGTGVVASVTLTTEALPSFCPVRYELNEGEFTKEEVEALGYNIEEEL